MWVVEGDKEIPIEYDDGRIAKIIDGVIKYVLETEKKRKKLEREVIDKISERRLLLIF